MVELGLKFTLAYLLGSVLGSLVVGRFYGGVDIRKVGSGNPGGTNALRTQGKMFALWVVVIDVGKGVLAVRVLPTLELPGVPLDPGIGRELLGYAAAFAVVLGHVFPVWYGFKGGKGGATAAGVLGALSLTLAIPAVAVWLLIIGLTGYVGLATMSAAAGVAVYVGFTRLAADPGFFVATALIAALIIYAHRINIERMRAGTEVRMGMFLRRK
jgi:acyl phosphate:glycerol-3-phosphate acyltransferase